MITFNPNPRILYLANAQSIFIYSSFFDLNPMNIYIGFTLSPKRYESRRLVAVLNYFLPKKDQPIQMAYITIMAIIAPIVILLKQIPQYCIQVINQVKHEAGKKHHRQTTYNDLNIRILNIIIPCIYLIPHLLQKFNYHHDSTTSTKYHPKYTTYFVNHFFPFEYLKPSHRHKQK